MPDDAASGVPAIYPGLRRLTGCQWRILRQACPILVRAHCLAISPPSTSATPSLRRTSRPSTFAASRLRWTSWGLRRTSSSVTMTGERRLVVAGSASADFARGARTGDEAPSGLRAPRLLSAWLRCACRRRRHGFGFRYWNGGFLGSVRTSNGSCGFVFCQAALFVFATRAARTWFITSDSYVCLRHW